MFIAEARDSVGKLVSTALGENDPAVTSLKEALRAAQAQCQVRL